MMHEVTAKEFDAFGFLEGDGLAGEEADFRSHRYDAPRPAEGADGRAWAALLARSARCGGGMASPALRAEATRLLSTSRSVPHAMRAQVWLALLQTDATRAAHPGFTYDAVQAQISDTAERRSERRRRAPEPQAAPSDGGSPVLAGAAGAASPATAPTTTTTTPAARAPWEEEAEDEKDGLLPHAKDVRQIGLDLDRTFYTHRLFMERDGAGQQALGRVLRAYAVLDPAVGYCQGMAYVAAVFLMVLETEEDAFWALTTLLQRPAYLHGFFSDSLAQVQVSANVLSGLVARRLPALSVHLTELNVHPLMYVTPWFMCLFTSLPLWDGVLGVWDALMLKGVNTIFRTAIAVMELCEDDLLGFDGLSVLLPYLQHLPPHKVRAEVLLAKVWAVNELELDGQVSMVRDVVRSGQKPEDCLPETWLQKVRAAKQAREQQAMEQQRKRRRTLQSQGGPDSTPSVFQRFFSRLATPLRSKVRADGQDLRSSSAPAFPALKTPARTTASRAPSLPAILSPIATSVVPEEACSPSFGRSGILSPSYFGDAWVLVSPVAPLMEARDAATPVTFKSPGSNELLDEASPAQRQSFAAFTRQTPLRPSQRATPVASRHATPSARILRDANRQTAFTTPQPRKRKNSIFDIFTGGESGPPSSGHTQEQRQQQHSAAPSGAASPVRPAYEMTPVSTTGKKRKQKLRRSGSKNGSLRASRRRSLAAAVQSHPAIEE